jgi:hypothetical protein
MFRPPEDDTWEDIPVFERDLSEIFRGLEKVHGNSLLGAN